jgi:hypothetical protein
MGDHFYLTLPSDAYVNYYPGNTASHFVAKSPERIHLESNYEVGLSEFIYPHTWNRDPTKSRLTNARPQNRD